MFVIITSVSEVLVLLAEVFSYLELVYKNSDC